MRRQHSETTFYMDKCANVGHDLRECDFAREGISAELDAFGQQCDCATKTLSDVRSYLNAVVSCGEKSRASPTEVVKIHETPVQGTSLQATSRRTGIKLRKLGELPI